MIRSVCLLAVLLLSFQWSGCAAQPRNEQLLPDMASDEAVAEAAAEYVQRLEQFVDQYRNLIAKSILRLTGACVAYDRLAATSNRNWIVGSERMTLSDTGMSIIFTRERNRNCNEISLRLSWNTATNIDIEQYILTVLRQLQTESPDQIAATFARQNATEPGVNVLFYIVTTSNMLKDPQLDALLAAMLYDQCCTMGDAASEGRCDLRMRKRQPQQQPPQKKQRFHAWGGKRSRGTSLGGTPAQVVIRAPFHSWGGRKRSVDDEMAN